jgi:dihydrofolate reductase
MNDPEPQTAAGKVLWHFLMTLDGFVAGPNHSMDWMTGISVRPGLHAEYIETTGAVLAGRNGFDGIRLYDNPAGPPIRLHRVGEGDPVSAVNVRYKPLIPNTTP